MSRRVLAGVLLAAFALAARTARAQQPQIQPPNEDQKRREEWFWEQRMYPGTERPYAEVERARRKAMLSPVISRAALSSLPPLAGAWRPLGPFGLLAMGATFTSLPQLDAGRVPAIAPPRVAGGPLLIGTASGGIWRSTNAGATWTPTTDNEACLTTGALAVDPVDPTIVYAGSGEYNAGSAGCGVFRSIDGGLSWTNFRAGLNLSNGAAASFGFIYVDPATAGNTASTILVGATLNGMARSTNSGTTWSSPLSGSPSSIVSTRPGILFTGIQDFNSANVARRGVWKSTNTGAQWSELPVIPGVDQSIMGRIELAVTPAAPDKVWAIVANTQTRGFIGIFVWDDVAQTWSQLAAKGTSSTNARFDFGGQADYDLVLTIDPRDANRMYLAGVRAFRSLDGGANFTPMAAEVHTDWHQIVLDPRNPDILYAGSDGGIFTSTDRGDTWTSRNSGLAITQYYPGIAISSQGTLVTGGSQDNGSHLFSGAQVWDGYGGGDGGYTAIHPTDASIQWAESQWSTTTGPFIVRRSTLSTALRINGITTTDRAQFIPPLIMDPFTPTKLYFGTHRLYRTVNDGILWTPVTGDLTKGTGTIRTIAVAPSDSNTIYVGTSDGLVQVSRDHGVTFTNVTAAPIPNRTVTRVVIDPTDPTHAVIALSGFGGVHVCETTNAGGSWRDISGNLGIAPVNSAAFVGTGTNLFVGTDVGVFQTIDDGVTWVAGPTGLPNVIVQDLVYSARANLLVAGTYGRGMFAYKPGGEAAVLRGDVNADGKVDAFDALLIQQALVGLAPNTTPVYPKGDANCNGAIDAADVVLVLRAAVGLPTGSACVGSVK